MSLRHIPRLLAGLALAGTLAAQPVTLSLLPPDHAATAGNVAAVELVVLNRTEAAQEFTAPGLLPARLTSGTRSWTVLLRATNPAPTTVAASGYTVCSYTFVVPAGVSGRTIVEAKPAGSTPVRAVLDIAAPEGNEPGAGARPITNLARAVPASSVIQRTLADRLTPHEPIYFIYGPDAPAAKFQFSFKYRLHDLPGLARLGWTRSLQLAFTQRSLWDIDGPSSPFYDTSYMPEVIFESLTPMPEQGDHRFTWLGYQVAFKHESNGRDGPGSRSLNTVYLRPAFVLGALDGWHLLVAPEVFTYVSSLEDNSALKDYRGYGQLHLVLGRNDGPSLMAAIWAGRKLNHASMQLDLTFPIRTKLLNFETYLLVQYFNGYGESLLSYRDQTESVRAGISLVR